MKVEERLMNIFICSQDLTMQRAALRSKSPLTNHKELLRSLFRKAINEAAAMKDIEFVAVGNEFSLSMWTICI